MKLPEEYYPTPTELATKMRSKVDMKTVASVLEPSAGDGGLIAVFAKSQYNLDYSAVDAIEIDGDLQAILKSKGIRVVYNDFLTYHSYKQYDLIAMNPPFSEGDKHLLKALDIQKHGGQIVCLLNAETLRNPYTNTRKDLVKQLEKYEADIEYIEGAFSTADRSTDVEIALVYVNISSSFDDCDILKNLEKAREVASETVEETQLTDRLESYLNAIVKQYEAETAAGVRLIREYMAFAPQCLNSFDEQYTSTILEMKIYDGSSDRSLVNDFLEKVRYKYWAVLFGRKEFYELMTENQRSQYFKRLYELAHYEFNLSNIKQIQLDLSKSSIKSIEDTILDLFDDFAIKYTWYKECDNNIHYYNGWATNKVGKVNKKVIIRLDAFERYDKTFEPRYTTRGKVTDIEKVFNFLDCNHTPPFDSVEDVLDYATRCGQTAKIEFKYFYITFYKKGTAHITFKDMELIKRFNIFVGLRKSGLPPSYGKKSYSDMTNAEQQVVNEFDGGEKEYTKVYNNPSKYIIESESMLMLESKEDSGEVL